MTAPANRSRALAHYGAILAEIKDPSVHRLTLEVTSLDPGTDLATCHFAMDARDGREKRFVRRLIDGRSQVVGLWRIVPAEAANV